MALTYKKQDNLEKMLEKFASLPEIKLKEEASKPTDKDRKNS